MPKKYRRGRLSKRIAVLESLEDRRLLAGDLVAQWRAEDLNHLLNDGDQVSNWSDSIAAVPTKNRGTPTLIKQQYGGRSTVRFHPSDGDDSLRISIADNPINRADNFSVIVTFVSDSQTLPGENGNWFEGAGLVDANALGFSKGWGIAMNSQGQIGAGLESGFLQPVTSLYSTATGLNDGQLHYVAFTRQAGTMTIYVDDQPTSSRDDGSPLALSDTEIVFGDTLSGNAAGFAGDISEIRFYDGALNAAEWLEIRNELSAYYDNQPPQVQPDSYTTAEDSVLLFADVATGVLANDLDAEGDSLTAILIDPPQHGVLSLNPKGSFIYDSDLNFFGEDTFRYAAVDFRESEPTTVTIAVTPTYDPAIAVPDEYKSAPDQILNVAAAEGLLANDVNLDAGPLIAKIATDVASGNLTLSEDGSFNYDPAGFSGVTTFGYQIDDGTRLSNEVTVTLTINSPPLAADDHYELSEDGRITSDSELGILANDVDAENDKFSATLISSTEHGSLSLQADGSFDYVPDPEFSGLDSFTYRIADYADRSPTVGTVTFNVLPINDRPIATGDLYLTFVDTPLTITKEAGLIANDIDVDNPILTPLVSQPPTHGDLQLKNDGSFVYTPKQGFEGKDQFRYTVNDGELTSTEAIVNLVVAPIDQQVIINEVHYDPPENTVPAEFIELFNQGHQPADLSDWFFTNGIRYVIPAGTIIEPLSYLVIAQHPATLQEQFGVNAIGPYAGRLSSEGEEITLRNSAGDMVDRVDYRQGFPWPIAAGGDGPSMELIHPSLDNQLGGSWRASVAPTPNAINSVHANNAPPQIRQVSHSPQQPKANETTIITAKVTDPNGVESVSLDYQIVSPGNFIPTLLPLPIRDLRRGPDDPREVNPAYVDPANWTTLVMVDDGTGADTVAGDHLYTASIPGQSHRTLMRYRINISDTLSESVTVPYEDDAARNFAYFVYDGVPDYGQHKSETLESVPVYHLIARNEDVTTMMGYSGRNQISQGTQARFAYNWPAAFVYDGVVYDNINMRLRGANGRYHLSGKRSMRFRFNDGQYFQAKDQAGEPISEKWRTLTTGKMFDNRQTQTWALNETVNMHLFNQLGVPAPETFYIHFRVIDGAEESPDQWSGDFWGLNFVIETYDVRFLDNHELERGNLYKLINQTRSWEQQQRYQAPNAVNDGSDHNEIENKLRGRSTADYINAHVNLEKYFQYHAFTEAIRHYDYWPDANKNMVYYFEPDYLPENNNRGKLWILPWDTDASWGPTWNSGHDVVYNSVFPASGGGSDRNSTEELWPAYYNAVREIRDLLWQRDQIEPLVEQFADVLRPMAAADFDRWRGGPASEGRYNGLTGEGTKGIDALVQNMKDFAFQGGNWPGGSVPNGGRARHLDRLLTNSRAKDEAVPAKPTISYQGNPNFPTNGLRFKTSNFSDAQGNDTFAGIEWRIAEVTDPNAPAFNPNADLLLEWNSTWESGVLAEFDSQIAPPSSAVQAGHAYRARVRMQDRSGHWSHWSDPMSFIATTATASELTESLRISEIHYHPSAPSQVEVRAGFSDADDFEFIELVNRSEKTLDLTGAEFVQAPLNGDPQGIQFLFAEGLITELAAGERVLIVEDVEAFRFRYGNDLPITGQWRGNLSNGGEQLTLLGDGLPIQQFTYSDDWYPITDGDGPSLELIDTNNTDLASWGQAASWRPSAANGGSPGTAEVPPVIGDSNADGVFDSGDLVAVFRAGEYEDNVPGNSSYAEGDWNADGDFDSGDLVFAFQNGNYARGATPLLASPQIAAALLWTETDHKSNVAQVSNVILTADRQTTNARQLP
ncbi:MAG: Ig-like domain-containing protein, partial [Pirellulaceae bacterium]|nr:Ig-like domain-containing protein [Pirellulaceae bacterium]